WSRGAWLGAAAGVVVVLVVRSKQAAIASALVALHLDVPARRVVLGAIDADAQWCTSALTLVESLALIDRVTDQDVLRSDLEDLVRLSWDRLAVVPVDQPCLDRAAALMRRQPLRLSDALHLAAADRLPRPVRFVTFDPAQIPVALSMEFDVIST
ncbi:MAG TPA: type II toxin-antitoxin system VapC family toxin, partial [Ilumatobacteraceae bacterium]|nr:type II toxin-antitoxin system VapC family toxin [Ilumatobacteraceae bacterium]